MNVRVALARECILSRTKACPEKPAGGRQTGDSFAMAFDMIWSPFINTTVFIDSELSLCPSHLQRQICLNTGLEFIRFRTQNVLTVSRRLPRFSRFSLLRCPVVIGTTRRIKYHCSTLPGAAEARLLHCVQAGISGTHIFFLKG